MNTIVPNKIKINIILLNLQLDKDNQIIKDHKILKEENILLSNQLKELKESVEQKIAKNTTLKDEISRMQSLINQKTSKV